MGSWPSDYKRFEYCRISVSLEGQLRGGEGGGEQHQSAFSRPPIYICLSTQLRSDTDLKFISAEIKALESSIEELSAD